MPAGRQGHPVDKHTMRDSPGGPGHPVARGFEGPAPCLPGSPSLPLPAPGHFPSFLSGCLSTVSLASSAQSTLSSYLPRNNKPPWRAPGVLPHLPSPDWPQGVSDDPEQPFPQPGGSRHICFGRCHLSTAPFREPPPPRAGCAEASSATAAWVPWTFLAPWAALFW